MRRAPNPPKHAAYGLLIADQGAAGLVSHLVCPPDVAPDTDHPTGQGRPLGGRAPSVPTFEPGRPSTGPHVAGPKK